MQEFSDKNRIKKEFAASGGVHHGARILGLVINMISGGTNKEDFGGAGWSSFDTEAMTASSEEDDVTDSRTDK